MRFCRLALAIDAWRCGELVPVMAEMGGRDEHQGGCTAAAQREVTGGDRHGHA